MRPNSIKLFQANYWTNVLICDYKSLLDKTDYFGNESDYNKGDCFCLYILQVIVKYFLVCKWLYFQ